MVIDGFVNYLFTFLPHLKFGEAFLGAGTLGNFDDVVADSLAERSAFSYCGDITDFHIPEKHKK